MSLAEKWQSRLREKIKGSDFYSENFEECAAGFVTKMCEKPLFYKVFNLSLEEREVFYKEAYDLYNEKRFQEAEEGFALLATLNPVEGKYWFSLGATLQMQQKCDEALKAYALSSLLEPENPYPHYHAAYCLQKLGRKDEGAQALDLARDLAKKEPRYMNLLMKMTRPYAS